VKTVKNLRRPLPQTQDQVQVSANAAIGYGLSCLTDRSDRQISCWRLL